MEFKVGDRVIIKDMTHGHGFSIGQEVDISKVTGGNSYECTVISGTPVVRKFVRGEELEASSVRDTQGEMLEAFIQLVEGGKLDDLVGNRWRSMTSLDRAKSYVGRDK